MAATQSALSHHLPSGDSMTGHDCSLQAFGFQGDPQFGLGIVAETV